MLIKKLNWQNFFFIFQNRTLYDTEGIMGKTVKNRKTLLTEIGTLVKPQTTTS